MSSAPPPSAPAPPPTPAAAGPATPAAAPAAGGAASLADIFKSVPIGQLVAFILVSQAVQPLLSPYANELQHLIYDVFPNVQLSPADLAAAVNRGFLDEATAGQEARRSGLNDKHFRTLIQLAGQALSPQDAAMAMRLGIIPEDSGNPDAPGFRQAIDQGNLRDMWAPIILKLAKAWPTPNDILDAYLEGQVDQATAQELYAKLGGVAEYFTLLYNTRGSAPTPTEAAVMANRGIIPWDGTGPEATTFQQAFLEGPWRNKWLEPYRKMSQYLPPPRTVVAMLKEGSLTDAEASKLLLDEGLPQDLVAAYIQSGHAQKLQGTKDLAQATVVSLYHDQLIDQATAHDMLAVLGYSDQDIAFILAISDAQRAQQALSQAVSRVHTLYVGHKLTSQAAVNALNAMRLPAAQVDGLLQVWDLERAANVRTLTETQIVDAWAEQVMTQDQAMVGLQNIGYSAYDAWVLLSVKNKGALPGQPPATSLPAGVGP